MSTFIEKPVTRVDGPDKVAGRARYAAEFRLADMAHAALVLSTVPRGAIAAMETEAAQHAPGVIAVITHENAPRLPYTALEERPPVDPDAGEQLHVLQGPEVLFSGQPVAIVVAESAEQAEHAAGLIEVSYENRDGTLAFDGGDGRRPVSGGDDGHGDTEATPQESDVTVDAVYRHPRLHHNAMEPHATIAAWEGDRLTLYDKTQWVDNDRREIAHVLGMAEDDIHVVSPFVGGAFGSGLRTWPHVTLAAVAARQAGRPVRLELTRRQLYTSIGFRPQTEQRVALSAGRDGRLVRLYHEAIGQTSCYEEYSEKTTSPSLKLYACPNVRTRHRVVEMNTNTPCPMRAPGTASGLYALESAMDELAEALGMDPVELRLTNHADRDEHSDLPWSSKELAACYRTAADAFGWHRRNARPGATVEDGLLVGLGMATTMYSSHRAAASASVTVSDNGTAVIRSAASDMGPGTYTSVSQVAAETLGLPLEKVAFELGDTDLPPAPVHGGSITMASVGSAVHAACRDLCRKVADMATRQGGPFEGLDAEDVVVHDEMVSHPGAGKAVPLSAVLRGAGRSMVKATAEAVPDEAVSRHSSAAFGAIFAEVRVDPDFGTVRVPKLVGAFDIGRVINPLIARSQCIGGMVGGLGMALMEQAEWDARYGRVMNANLAEYLVPVCADVQQVDVSFVDSDDPVLDPLGAKGVAELSINGVAPAIANAVHNATGRRIRDLPITPDKLLGA